MRYSFVMNPSSNRNRYILIVIVLVALIAVLYFLHPHATAPDSSIATTTSNGASSTVDSITISANGASSTGAYTIHMITAADAPKAPDYHAPLVFSSSVPADEEASISATFAQAQATIAKTPQDFNAWIALGAARKQAGDYVGAEADWQYVSALYPTNVVSYANLGDLYQNYLHEYAKAVAAYKQQIVNYPKAPYIYDNLYQIYTHEYPVATSTITAMLKAGIAANPDATQLKNDLAALGN